MVKNPPVNVEDTGSIPESGQSPGGGHDNPLQYPCLENPMDRSLAGYSPWGHKESDRTERLNNNSNTGDSGHSCLIADLREMLSVFHH